MSSARFVFSFLLWFVPTVLAVAQNTKLLPWQPVEPTERLKGYHPDLRNIRVNQGLDERLFEVLEEPW